MSAYKKEMADWRSRSEISGDVVLFRYVPQGTAKNSKEVYVWDLDKTYLDTSWGSVRDLFETIMEKAFHKRNIPGTNTLLQALTTTWESRYGNRHLPLYFITASPPQMEGRIREKLDLDELKPFGFFCKDNLKNIHPKRLWRLTKQVGYKLQALLQLRVRLSPDVRQILWGDDSESDAIIYNLYSDICARRLGASEIRHILKDLYVTGDQVDTILLLQAQVPSTDPVEKIYINLAEDTDPDYYLKFGRRTLPTYNTFQTSLDLLQDKRLEREQVVRVAQDILLNYGFTVEELTRSLDDLIRRKVLGLPFCEEVIPFLKQHSLITPDFTPSLSPRRVVQEVEGRVFELEGSFEPWVPEHVDYLHDYR